MHSLDGNRIDGTDSMNSNGPLKTFLCPQDVILRKECVLKGYARCVYLSNHHKGCNVSALNFCITQKQ